MFWRSSESDKWTQFCNNRKLIIYSCSERQCVLKLRHQIIFQRLSPHFPSIFMLCHFWGFLVSLSFPYCRANTCRVTQITIYRNLKTVVIQSFTLQVYQVHRSGFGVFLTWSLCTPGSLKCVIELEFSRSDLQIVCRHWGWNQEGLRIPRSRPQITSVRKCKRTSKTLDKCLSVDQKMKIFQSCGHEAVLWNLKASKWPTPSWIITVFTCVCRLLAAAAGEARSVRLYQRLDRQRQWLMDTGEIYTLLHYVCRFQCALMHHLYGLDAHVWY